MLINLICNTLGPLHPECHARSSLVNVYSNYPQAGVLIGLTDIQSSLQFISKILVGPSTKFPNTKCSDFQQPSLNNTVQLVQKESGMFSGSLCMSETAAQEGQYRELRSSLPAVLEYNTMMELPLRCNTIGRNPSPSPTLGQNTYLHLQANILDAVTFLWSRWFSKTLQHSSTQAMTLPYDRREMSLLFLHLFHPSHRLCCCLLFLLRCLPVLTTKALYKERKAQCSSGSRADSTGPKVYKDFSVMERGNNSPSNLFWPFFLFGGWNVHQINREKCVL